MYKVGEREKLFFNIFLHTKWRLWLQGARATIDYAIKAIEIPNQLQPLGIFCPQRIWEHYFSLREITQNGTSEGVGVGFRKVLNVKVYPQNIGKKSFH